MFDVGKGCFVAEKWVPKDCDTGLYDINGVGIKTRDKIKLTGCTSKYAYIGYSTDMELMLIFGSKSGSVGWKLTSDRIQKNKIEVIL